MIRERLSDYYSQKLRVFLHDPLDKFFQFKESLQRAQDYAKILGMTEINKSFSVDDYVSAFALSVVQDINGYSLLEIRHPLSEGKIIVNDSLNFLELKHGIEETFKALKDEAQKYIKGDNYEFLFYYLWRNLLFDLMEKFKNTRFKKYLPILPEDPRFPDYSIWDHLKISTALNIEFDEDRKIWKQNNSLFVFTIGPVQSFISQARKTLDFYMGSFILSYLTYKAIEVLVEQYGPTQIIYPDLKHHALMDLWLKSRLGITPRDYDESLIYLPSIPNRFVALLPTTDSAEIRQLGEAISNKIKKEIDDAISLIFDELRISRKEIDSLISQQISEVFNTYWVAVPWKINGNDISIEILSDYVDENLLKEVDDLVRFVRLRNSNAPEISLIYGVLYTLTEKGLGAVKNVRRFSQTQVPERGGRRCSVCGEREVLFFSATDPKGKARFKRFNDYALDLTRTISAKYLAEDEGLCAVCFLKRTFELYLKNTFSGKFELISFPSTAEVAAAGIKSRYIQNAPNEFLEFAKKLKEVINYQNAGSTPKVENLISQRDFYLNPPAESLFLNNLRSDYMLKEFGLSVSQEFLSSLKSKLRNLYEKVGKPSSYYAVIYLDGDNMGSWLSGEKLPIISSMFNSQVWEAIDKNLRIELERISPKKPLNPVIHNIISRALNNFTFKFVKRIVEQEHLGKLIYAGGDDVLAITPIQDLFDIMHKLRWSFSGQVKVGGCIEVDWSNNTGFVDVDGEMVLTMGPEASASMGVVIAHHKTPLQIVIKKVFEMEKIAKDIGRNAFSICFMRHSGEERIAKAFWKSGDRDTIKILKDVDALFNEQNNYYLSRRTLSKLFESFLHLLNLGAPADGTELEATRAELKRVIKRSLVFNEKLKSTEIQVAEARVLEILWTLFEAVNFNSADFVNFIYLIINAGKMEG